MAKKTSGELFRGKVKAWRVKPPKTKINENGETEITERSATEVVLEIPSGADLSGVLTDLTITGAPVEVALTELQGKLALLGTE